MMKVIEMIDDMTERLVCGLFDYLEASIDEADTREVGEVADIIKDMAEAKEKEIKAKYYIQIIEAMEKEEEENSGRKNSGEYEHMLHKYMEAAENGEDRGPRMQALQAYMEIVTGDIMQAVTEMDPQERQYLKNSITALNSRI